MFLPSHTSFNNILLKGSLLFIDENPYLWSWYTGYFSIERLWIYESIVLLGCLLLQQLPVKPVQFNAWKGVLHMQNLYMWRDPIKSRLLYVCVNSTRITWFCKSARVTAMPFWKTWNGLNQMVAQQLNEWEQKSWKWSGFWKWAYH